ncbi:unnamed protein product [Cochlearia groenlandica]
MLRVIILCRQSSPSSWLKAITTRPKSLAKTRSSTIGQVLSKDKGHLHSAKFHSAISTRPKSLAKTRSSTIGQVLSKDKGHLHSAKFLARKRSSQFIKWLRHLQGASHTSSIADQTPIKE